MHGFIVDVLRLTLWLVLLMALFVPLERLFGLTKRQLLRPQTGVDLAWYFINSIAVTAIIAWPLALLARGLQGLDPLGLYSTVAAWPVWLRLVAALLVNDIGAYWMHRWQHASPRLWAFHAIHHSAEQVDWLTNSRAHPLDMVLVRLAGLTPVYLLGLASTQGGFDPIVAWVSIASTVWSYFIHANVRWRLGALEWVISTPAFHHWHHTNDAHRDRNFAAIFPLLDRLFGTLYLPRDYPTVYGVDRPVSPRLLDQMIDPFFTKDRQSSTPPLPG